MEICAPYTLSRLPRSQIDHGRTLFSPVYGVAQGRKRKRQELCIAVDGDSISVYEVRTGRNLSSQPIPPDSILSCPPCSLRFTTSTGRRSRRTYYVAGRKNTLNLSFFEDRAEGDAGRPVTKSIPLAGGEIAVVQLEVLSSSDTSHVLVVREDGNFEIYNENLSSRIRHGRLSGVAPGNHLITAQWLSPTMALKSVLKPRRDIIAATDPTSSFILGIFNVPSSQNAEGPGDILLGVWTLSGFDSGFFTEPSAGPLLQHRISITSPLLSRDREPITFISGGIKIVVKTLAKVLTVDLTSLSLRTEQDSSSPPAEGTSSIFITDTLCLSATSNALQLHNVEFRTLQAKLDLNKAGLKRKRSQSSGGQIIFQAYFPSLSRVVATRREQMIAIDLPVVGSSNFSAAVRQTSLLINNIGRGIVSTGRQKSLGQTGASFVSRSTKLEDSSEQLEKFQRQSEQYISDKNYEKFEDLCLIKLDDSNPETRTKTQPSINSRADFVISKIFEYETATDSAPKNTTLGLKLAFPASKILELLALKGFLTASRINKALRVDRSNVTSDEHDRIPQLLASADPSLELLSKYLSKAPYLPIQELGASIQLLLRQALVESDAASRTALTTMEGASSTMSTQTGSVLAVPTHIATSLCAAIERSGESASGPFTKYMHEKFTQQEMVALVQFLRQQLYHSGYTRSLHAQVYPTPPPSACDHVSLSAPSQDQQTTLSLPAIVSALSSCIDAIGPIGVLGFSDEAFVQTLIPELTLEISRATEAIQDSVFLEGMLRETLRFVESAGPAQTQKQTNEDLSDCLRQRLGTVVTLYSEPTTVGSLGYDASALPLGLRVEGKVNAVKVRKGDGKISRRSEREIGMHQDRLRGAYALERLIL